MKSLKNKTKKREIPKFPKKLPGSFWGVTTFYNSNKCKKKIKNYHKFRESSKNQGLNLICIELAFGNSKFELKKGDAEILLQLKTKNILWQKERLINIGLKYLPKDCDKFAWIDSDIIFKNNNWINETCKLLESYIIVQPFSQVILLPRKLFEINPTKNFSEYKKKFEKISIAYAIKNLNKKKEDPSVFSVYHTGLAWASRREIYDKNRFYDKFIVGGADQFMSYSFYNNKPYSDKDFLYNQKIIKDYNKWANNIYKYVKGSVYCTKGSILHLWHGRIKNRFYRLREGILKKYNFDPNKDIKLDKDNCWIWATHKPKLHKSIKRYFWMRNEEGSIFLDSLLLFYREYLKLLKIWHRMLGKIGIFLKKYNLALYFKLKKLEKKIIKKKFY
jgi:hypothetical protein